MSLSITKVIDGPIPFLCYWFVSVFGRVPFSWVPFEEDWLICKSEIGGLHGELFCDDRVVPEDLSCIPGNLMEVPDS